MKLSLSQARQIALHTQGLNGTWPLPPGKEAAAQTIETLGYVQIDTIHIIHRAHHHVLWTRNPAYAPAMLDELLSPDRRVFEWWTHAMSYIPMCDYRYYRPRMGLHAVGPRRRKIMAEHPDTVALVRQRIRDEGALGSKDFKKPAGFNGGWWNWKPAKHILESLTNMGELMVTHRHNFQRIFDLTERVLPATVDTRTPTPEEMHRYRIRLVLNGLGIAREKDLTWKRRDIDMNTVQTLLEQGEITRFEVAGIQDMVYAPTKNLNAVLKGATGTPQLHIFSPFDNFTIRRDWVAAFFDNFVYRIECYTPTAKRKYGYFVLPIFWYDADGNSRFIGRLDSKADRKPKTLIIKRLLFEPGFEDFEAVLPLFVDKLRAFAIFNGCEKFALEDVQPKKLKTMLNQHLTPLDPLT